MVDSELPSPNPRRSELSTILDWLEKNSKKKKITLRWQGAACRAGRSLEEPLRWRRKEAPRTWVAKDGVADTETLDVFNELWTSRWQSVWSL